MKFCVPRTSQLPRSLDQMVCPKRNNHRGISKECVCVYIYTCLYLCMYMHICIVFGIYIFHRYTSHAFINLTACLSVHLYTHLSNLSILSILSIYLSIYLSSYRSIYLSIYTYIHTYAHTYIHTYLHTYIHTYIRVHMHICNSMCIFIYTQAYTHDLGTAVGQRVPRLAVG